ncbi:MAG: YHYH domain-containing protein [Bacillota bacterium]
MSKKICLLTFIFLLVFGSISFAHSGRTDSKGGHNCSAKSQAKGLCSGYHYHNGGGTAPSEPASTAPAAAPQRNDKDCTEFANYDEVVEYWNAKGYSAQNDPENLDGWGNGVVDDGIPCEAPDSYDKSKINNSPEQVQAKQDESDKQNGMKDGRAKGLEDGYNEVTPNEIAASGSIAYSEGYEEGYTAAYAESKKKMDAEKEKAMEAGTALGEKQDSISIPEAYSKNESLKSAFEAGFTTAVNERIEAKRQEYADKGYSDGKKDLLNLPSNVDERFIKAYQESYDKAQVELKEQYTKQGYEAAFTMLKYNDPSLGNEKLTGWYKEGFESNNEIDKIKEVALSSGEAGEDYSIPVKYNQGEVIYKHYYNLGYKEYEENQRDRRTASAGVAGAAVLGWLGRRFYVAKKMVS